MDLEKTVLFTHTGVSTDPATLLDGNGEVIGEFNYIVLEDAAVTICSSLKELAVSTGRKTAHIRAYGSLKYCGMIPIKVEGENLVAIDYSPFRATSVPMANGREVGKYPTLFFVNGKLWSKELKGSDPLVK